MIRLLHARLAAGTLGEEDELVAAGESEKPRVLPLEIDEVKEINVTPFSTRSLFNQKAKRRRRQRRQQGSRDSAATLTDRGVGASPKIVDLKQ